MTLEPGIYDGSEAPWWRFTSPQVALPVVRQWMKQAAEVFAIELSKANAGGTTRVHTLYLTVDGSVGRYQVFFQHHRLPVEIEVHRGEQTMEHK